MEVKWNSGWACRNDKNLHLWLGSTGKAFWVFCRYELNGTTKNATSRMKEMEWIAISEAAELLGTWIMCCHIVGFWQPSCGTRPQLAIDSASKQWLPNGLQEWTCTKDTTCMIGSHLKHHPGYSLSWALLMEGPNASLLWVWYSFPLLGFHRPEDDINPEGDTKMGNQPASFVLSSDVGWVNVNVCTLYIPNESCCNDHVIIKSNFWCF
jgi:hypothetical protein